jgi:hypothetical protein
VPAGYLSAYGISAPISTSLAAGGPITVIWGKSSLVVLARFRLFDDEKVPPWVVVSMLTFPLAFSLGEVPSTPPLRKHTAGALDSPLRRLAFLSLGSMDGRRLDNQFIGHICKYPSHIWLVITE